MPVRGPRQPQRVPGGRLADGRVDPRYPAGAAAEPGVDRQAPRGGDRPDRPGPVRGVRGTVDGGPMPGLRVPPGGRAPRYGGGGLVTDVATTDLPDPGSDPRRSMQRRVFVAGAGIMGSGIAAQCAVAGFAVTLEDVTEEFARRGLENAKRALESAAKRGAFGAPTVAEALGRIDVAIGLRRAEGADLVIE